MAEYQHQTPKNEYLVRNCFKHLNNYKRARALKETSMTPEVQELEMYKQFDQLELALRGLQKEIKSSNTQDDAE